MSSISHRRQLRRVHDDDGVYLGRTTAGDATSGSERSTLVLGPSRSGKTSSIIVPNLLLTTRSVVATSTKDDVLRTIAERRTDGATLVFDPSGSFTLPPGVQRVGYSPLRQAQSWDGAVLATRTLTDVARRVRGEGVDDHWTERAGALVAPLLHAASLEGASLGQAAAQLDRRDPQRAVAVLNDRYGPEHPSTALLDGILQTDPRELSGIWSTASGLFAGLRTDAARSASRDPALDLDEFLRGPNQLHIVSPSRVQSVSTPLVVGALDEIVQATYQRHDQGARLLLALDELANVAPLPRLASIVSEGGGQGVVTVACLQDLSQARARWGAAAAGFLSLFPTTVVLPGIADRDTLELISRLSGRVHVPSHSRHGGRGRASTISTAWVEHERLSVAEVATGRPGFALGLRADKSLGWIRLTPAHADARWRTTEPLRDTRYRTRDSSSRATSRER